MVDDVTYDLREVTDDLDGAFFAADGIARVRRALRAGRLPVLVEASAMRAGPPLARPGAVICIGMNYAAHVAESGAAPPEHPVMFLKTPNTTGGPDDPVTIPRGSTRTDWEVELGVVIGTRTSYPPSPRRRASSTSPVSSSRTTCPSGIFSSSFPVASGARASALPVLALPGRDWSGGRGGNHRDLRLRSWVNGESHQNSSTGDMIFDVEFIVWHLSQYLVLEPGDLVLTGTPEGLALSGRFPNLSAGDVVELEISGLGRQRHEMVALQEER